MTHALSPFLIAVLLLAACGRVDDSLVAPPTTSWPTNGGNWYNQRYSPLTQIDRSNVASLKGVWRTRLGGSGAGAQHSGEAQPLVVDGLIYVPTGANDLYALDVTTGAIVWEYRANLDAGREVANHEVVAVRGENAVELRGEA